MFVALTMVSENRKVGPIPVSTTEKESCPPDCPLLGDGCYASYGPLAIQWKRVSERARGMAWTAFCTLVAALPKFQLWRHNQAGDLPKDANGKIDHAKCRELSQASRHTRGWTYTHHSPTDPHNAAIIREMNSVPGLTVNLSANNLAQADEYYAMGIGPVVVLLPEDAPHRGNKTPGGLPIVVCPAQTQEDMSCHRCELCRHGHRKSVVGFLAHGAGKKKATRHALAQ